MTFFITAQTTFHHCTFQVITAHFCASLHAKTSPEPVTVGTWIIWSATLLKKFTWIGCL